MNDLISRQAAISAIQNAYCDTEGGEDKCAVWKNIGLTNALHIMQDLPSAQPEIVRCKDCKYCEYPAPTITRYRCSLFDRCVIADWFCADAERGEPSNEP